MFLRELISNANDALEKLRLTSLTNRDMWDGSSPLNITIKTLPAEDGSSGRIVIAGKLFSLSNHPMALRLNTTDNGIGMTPEEMTRNLVRARLD